MTRMIRMSTRFVVLAWGLLLISSMASGTMFTCGVDTIGNVAIDLSGASGNSLGCGTYSFSNFAVSVLPAGSITVGISNFSSFVGGVANLQFQLGAVSGNPADVLMFYKVNGPLTSVDLKNGGTNVTIQEVVCAVPFAGPSCSSPLATLVVPAQGAAQSYVFAVTNTAYIKKDIQFGAVGAFISDFSNSHSVPEPITAVLLGSGLLAFGYMLRRRRRNG